MPKPPPPYVVERIRRDPPPDRHVVVGSTPVVAFGNPSSSAVATLGLNPSRIEFREKGKELDGPLRRFETLQSLGIERLSHAPDDAVNRIWDRCNRYFHGNPYKRWFNPLEEVVNALGASFFANTACHLDLSQWATHPTWNGLDPATRCLLVRDDVEFLRQQLRAESIRVLLLNGIAVIKAFEKHLNAHLEREHIVVSDGHAKASLFTGVYETICVIGWSANLQSSRGITRAFKQKLAAQVRDLFRRGCRGGPGMSESGDTKPRAPMKPI